MVVEQACVQLSCCRACYPSWKGRALVAGVRCEGSGVVRRPHSDGCGSKIWRYSPAVLLFSLMLFEVTLLTCFSQAVRSGIVAWFCGVSTGVRTDRRRKCYVSS